MNIPPAYIKNNAISTLGLGSVGRHLAQLPLPDLTASAASKPADPQPADRAALRRDLLAEEKTIALAEALLEQDPALLFSALLEKDYRALLAKLSPKQKLLRRLNPEQVASIEQASGLLQNLQKLNLRGPLLDTIPFDFNGNKILDSDLALLKSARSLAIRLFANGSKPAFIAEQLNNLFTATAKRQPGWLELDISISAAKLATPDEKERKSFYDQALAAIVPNPSKRSVWNAETAKVIGPGGPPAVRKAPSYATDPRYDAFFGGPHVMTRVVTIDYKQLPVYEKVSGLLKDAGWEILDWDKGKAKKIGTKNQTKRIVELIVADREQLEDSEKLLKMFRERILSTDKILVTRDPTQIAQISNNRCWGNNCLQPETGLYKDKISTKLFPQGTLAFYVVRQDDPTAKNPTGAALVTQFDTYSPAGERLDQPALHVFPQVMGNVDAATQKVFQTIFDKHFNQNIPAAYTTMLHYFPFEPFGSTPEEKAGYGDHRDTFRVLVNGETVRATELGNLNFSGWDFSGKDVVSSTLIGGNFSGANFSNIRTLNAHFADGDYTNANFDGAIFTRDSQISNFRFQKSHPLDGSSVKSGFIRSNLNGASFVGADLGSTKFFSSQLRGVNFDGAEVHGAGFYNNDMRGAKLSWQGRDVTLLANDLRHAEIGAVETIYLPGFAQSLLTNRLQGATFDEGLKLKGPLSDQESLSNYRRSSPKEATFADMLKFETLELVGELREYSPEDLGNQTGFDALSTKVFDAGVDDFRFSESYLSFLVPKAYRNLLDNLGTDQFKLLGDDPDIQQAIAAVKPQLDVLRQMADEADKAKEANQAQQPTVPDPYAVDGGAVYRPDPPQERDPRADWPVNNPPPRTVFDPNDINNKAPVFSTTPGERDFFPRLDPAVNPNYPITPEGKKDQEQAEQREREQKKQDSLTTFPGFAPSRFQAPRPFLVNPELSQQWSGLPSALARSSGLADTDTVAGQTIPAPQPRAGLLGQPPVSAVNRAKAEHQQLQVQLGELKRLLNGSANVERIQEVLTDVARSVGVQREALEQVVLELNAGANQWLKAAAGPVITELEKLQAWAAHPDTAKQLQKGAVTLGEGVLTIALAPLAALAWLYGQLSGNNRTQGGF